MTPCEMAAIVILLFTLPLPWWYGWIEGVSDARKIFRNGSADSLKEKWHRDNAIRRGLVLGAGSLVIWYVLHLTIDAHWLVLPALFWVASALFGYKFTTKLNTCRKLHPWYVSLDKRASKTDKFFVKYSANLKITPEKLSELLHKFSIGISFIFLIIIIAKFL